MLIKKAGVNEKFSYVSTGGGAGLDLLRTEHCRDLMF
jgi:3-phosphoglycerate kinase